MSTPVEQEIEEARKLEKERLALYRAERLTELRSRSRLSFPFFERLAMATSISFIAGAALGVSHGSQKAGYQFRAENAHRLPNSTVGWYLYHKSKNYARAYAGVKEGMRMGGKVAFWTAGFFSIEDMFDRYRGKKDFINTVIASLSVAGGFSLWNGFPITTAARTAKTGLAFGLAYGLVQDALSTAKGRRPAYVDFILRGGRRQKEELQMEQSGSGLIPRKHLPIQQNIPNTGHFSQRVELFTQY